VLTAVKILSLNGARLRLLYGGRKATFDTKPGETLLLDGRLRVH
jgi:hypothetical protein